MKVLPTSPGQGGQRPGMLAAILDRKAISTQMRIVLGDEVATLDSTGALRHTRTVQLCLLIAGVAQACELRRQGVDLQMVSGLSIGTFPAAVIAGVLDFASMLRLVALHGNLMEQAYPEGHGLTTIMGPTRPWVEVLMQGYEVYFVNLSAETQIVTTGCGEAVAEVAQPVLWVGASKAWRLAVSIPSYCVLLNKLATALARAFTDVTLTRSQRAYLGGSMACMLWDLQWIADDLVMNVACTVHWQEAMIAADERDARLVTRIPFGGVLTYLARWADQRGETISLERSGVDVVRHLTQRLSG